VKVNVHHSWCKCEKACLVKQLYDIEPILMLQTFFHVMGMEGVFLMADPIPLLVEQYS